MYLTQFIWIHMLSHTMWQHYTAHRYLQYTTCFKLHASKFIIRSIDFFDRHVLLLFSKMITKDLKCVNIKEKISFTRSKECHVIRCINSVSFFAINNICTRNSFKTNFTTCWPRYKMMGMNILLLKVKYMVLCVQITGSKCGKKVK